MVEGGALEVSEEEVVEALTVAQKGIRELIGDPEGAARQGRPADEDGVGQGGDRPAGSRRRSTRLAEGKIARRSTRRTSSRRQAVEGVKKEIADAAARRIPGQRQGDRRRCSAKSSTARCASRCWTTGQRVDGRDPNESGPISIDTGVLPRAHGSALFTRGQTQALVSVTLGTPNDVQRLDTIDEAGETTKSFMLHYNFPPFSTGEVRPMRGTSRSRDRPRRPGRARAAARAAAVRGVPVHDAHRLRHPRVERLVVDGARSAAARSRSWTPASRCGPPCAGVAMGLIKEGDKYAMLTDILGTEDHLGDMDFKVAGTAQGHHLDPDGHQDRGARPQDHGEALAQARKAGCTSSARWPRRCRAADRPVAVRAAHRHDADQPREDRRPDRPEGQDDPRHSGRDGRRDQRRGQRHRHDRRRRRRGGGSARGRWCRRSPPSPRSAGRTRGRSRARRRSAPSSRSCRASRGCCTSPSCSTAAPRRPRTWSRRATASR